MDKPIYFDISAILILILLLSSIVIRKLYVERHSKIFIIMIVMTLISTIFDILSCVEIPFVASYISHTLYFVFHTSLSLIFLIYILDLTGILDSFIIKKYKLFLIALPYILMVILFSTNKLTDFIFKLELVDGELIYSHGILIYAIYGLSALYLLISLIYLLYYRSLFSRKQIVSLFAVYAFVTVALVIQFIFSEILIEMLAFTISLMCICNSAEEISILQNQQSRCGNIHVYEQIIKKNYVHKKDTNIIFLRIVNYEEFFKSMNYNIVLEKIRDFVSDLQTKYKNSDPTYKVYDLENGVFALICKDYDSVTKVIGDINNDLISGYYYNPVLNIQYKLYYVNTNYLKNLSQILKIQTILFDDAFLETTKIDYKEILEEIDFNISYNIESIIVNALNNDKLLIYFNPIYSLKTDSFDTVEILSRIDDPKYGLIYPKKYINKAIKLNLINQIDDIVLSKVIQFIKSPIFSYLKIKHININIATEELFDPLFAKNLINKLKDANINPSILSIEIIEKGYEDQYKNINNNINDLRDSGIGVILDDYGVGYSNIESIIDLNFSGIKFDHNLFASLKKENTKIVISHEIKSIRTLKRNIIIEGIETEEDLKFIQDLEINYIQGFHFSDALEYNDFIKFIQENEYQN